MSAGQGGGGGELYSEVQCIMGNGHMGTRVKTLPSSNFILKLLFRKMIKRFMDRLGT